MIEKVSESEHGQNKLPPSREQRDEAYSTGAGRKAIEIPIEQDMHQPPEPEGEAPVGLELETQAHEFEED